MQKLVLRIVMIEKVCPGRFRVVCDGDGEVHDDDIDGTCPPRMEMTAKRRGWKMTYSGNSPWPVSTVCTKCIGIGGNE